MQQEQLNTYTEQLVNTYTEQRECIRLSYETYVMVTDCRTGQKYPGRLYDYNRLGLYLESDFPLYPGSDVDIRFESSPYITNPEPLKAEVRWCNCIDGSTALYRFGIGIKYKQDVNC